MNNPTYAKHQPCGCVLCTCEDNGRCLGCGAKFCDEHRALQRGDAPYLKDYVAADISQIDGGPAFPFVEPDGEGRPAAVETGMSLRDYFMAHAPFGIADANDAFWKRYRRKPHNPWEALSMLAALRVAYADEMLKAREVRRG